VQPGLVQTMGILSIVKYNQKIKNFQKGNLMMLATDTYISDPKNYEKAISFGAKLVSDVDGNPSDDSGRIPRGKRAITRDEVLLQQSLATTPYEELLSSCDDITINS